MPAEMSFRRQVSTALSRVFLAQSDFFSPNCHFAFRLIYIYLFNKFEEPFHLHGGSGGFSLVLAHLSLKLWKNVERRNIVLSFLLRISS